MRVARFNAPGYITLDDVPDPELTDTGILVDVAACGICGSDLITYATGTLAVAGQIMGHEFAGVITAKGDRADSRLPVGMRVAVLPLIRCHTCRRCATDSSYLCEPARELGYDLPGAFAERVHVPDARLNVNVFELPDNVELTAGALVEPLTIAGHIAGLVNLQVNDEIAVFGLGTVGAGVVRHLHLRGAHRIVGVDPSDARRRIAHTLGADVVMSPITQDLRGALTSALSTPAAGDGFDTIIDCSGKAAMLQVAISAVRRGGTVVAAAQYPSQDSVDPSLIMNREIKLQGSSAARASEGAQSVELLSSGRIDPNIFVSATFGLDDVQAAFEYHKNVEHGLKVMVSPGA
jgi:(R,R)-butanediol dehydrogenase / meso-butanediol dehydrogenase / diacetyl reductase